MKIEQDKYRRDLSEYKKIAKFDSTLVENMSILSSMDNYYKWIGKIMGKYVGKRVLEIGCANGNLTQMFLNREFIMGTDYSRNYLKQIQKRFKDVKNLKFAFFDATDRKSAIELKKYNFDTVVTMNTFEHIDNDVLALKNAYEALEKKGRIVMVVPAMNFLYSILDYEGGHYRRYTKRELAEKLKSAGFTVEKKFYINLPGAIGWYFSCVLMKKRIYSKSSFKLYNALVPLFSVLEKIFPIPFGLSVVCVARKD
jgi:SAM-dependent methyltransferase